jgi:hypothetical protein
MLYVSLVKNIFAVLYGNLVKSAIFAQKSNYAYC